MSSQNRTILCGVTVIWRLVDGFTLYFLRTSDLCCVYISDVTSPVIGRTVALTEAIWRLYLKPFKTCQISIIYLVIYWIENIWSANNKGDVNCQLLVSWQVINVTSVISGFDPAAVNESPLEPKRKHMNIPLRPYLFCLPRPSLFSLVACVCLSQQTGSGLHVQLSSLSLSVIYCLSPWAKPITGEEDEPSVILYRHSARVDWITGLLITHHSFWK